MKMRDESNMFRAAINGLSEAQLCVIFNDTGNAVFYGMEANKISSRTVYLKPLGTKFSNGAVAIYRLGRVLNKDCSGWAFTRQFANSFLAFHEAAE